MRWRKNIPTLASFSLLTLSSAAIAAAPTNPPASLSSSSMPSLSSQPAADPLEEWKTLTAPGASVYPADRYAAFLQRNLDWPLKARLQWRFEHALAQESDSTRLQMLCSAVPEISLRQTEAFLACAPYMPHPEATARKLWVAVVAQPDDEAQLLARFGTVFTAEDQWNRYERLEATGAVSAARRQIARLTPTQQLIAQTRLALRTGAPEAETLYASLPLSEQTEEPLLLLRLRNLRRTNRLDDAGRLWKSAGLAVQQRVDTPKRKQAWSAERNALMRAFLQQNDLPAASSLAGDETLPPTDPYRQDAAFLSAYAALRLDRPAEALHTLDPLLTVASLPVRAQGLHWTAQAQSALGNDKEARATLARAAQIPTSFYGQFSQACLSATPYLTTPQRTPALLAQLDRTLAALPALASAPLRRTDLAQAAETLSAEGEAADTTLFLTLLTARATTPGELKSTADEAERLQNPTGAILAARVLSRKGYALYPQGYPLPYQPEHLPPSALVDRLPNGLSAALIRQESSGDPSAVSPARAYGLMQLLPSTAAQTARRHGQRHLNTSPAALVSPRTNLLLGTLFLQELYDRFEQQIPHLLSAYNAGPARTRQWLAQETPVYFEGRLCSVPEMDMLGWISFLPYKETRHYIEQIETDYTLYALPTR